MKNGHDVDVITCVPNIPNGVVYEGYKNRFKQTEFIDGIKVIRVWTYIAANKGTLKRIINYASYMISASLAGLFVKKPDIVIATSPQFFCGWSGVFVSKIRRLPFILEIRDIWPESIIAVGGMSSKLIIKILEKLEKMMYTAPQHIVTVGEGYKQKLIEKGVRSKRISVITNGVDRALFYPRRTDEGIRQRYNLDGHFVCAYAGTIGMACGLDIILRAAKILRDKERDDFKFVLIGDGAVKDQLQQQAVTERLDNIIFVGRQDRKVIPYFLSAVDCCLVHLRKTELFKTVLPSKIFEATALAKPVVLGVEGCAADLVRSAKAGICIEPENAEELVAALERLADDPRLCSEFGRAGREYVVKHYDRDKLARDYLDVITRVALTNKRTLWPQE